MERWKNLLVSFTLLLALVAGMSAPQTDAAGRLKLSRKKVTIKVGQKKTIKVKNAKKKAIWKIKTGKKYISLAKKKKKSVTIKGKKQGKAVVTAKVGKKKLTCKVTIKKKDTKKNDTPKPSATSSLTTTDKPGTSGTSPATDKPATPSPTATDRLDSSTPSNTPLTGEKISIVLDPGHGGTAVGNTRKEGTATAMEKEYALEVAQYAREALEADGRFEVYLTRDDDTNPSLMDRAKYAVSKDADVMVSIHFNSVADTNIAQTAAGTEIWQSVLPKYQVKGLPEEILQTIHEKTGLSVSRGVKKRGSEDGTCWNEEKNWDTSEDTRVSADYYGLIKGGAKWGVPTMIVEHAFFTNDADFAYISTKEGRKALGEADAQALISYYTGHTHDWSQEETDYPASCITKGRKAKHCSICRADSEVSAIADEIPADAHFMGEYTLKEATFKEPEKEVRSCRYGCGEEESRKIEGKTETQDITIYHTNDMHGHLNEAIGIDRVAALKKSTEASLLLDAGDATQGAPLATLSNGGYVIDLMNLAGYDAMVTGNHEFDYGQDQLKKLAALAEFPILGANVTKGGSPLLQGEYGENKESNGQYVILEKAGAKIGIFGLTTQETITSSNPAGTVGITFEDEIETAKSMIDALEAEKVDVILCMAHLGEIQDVKYTSMDVAEALTGKYQGKLDAIIDGHSHTLENKEVNGVRISQTGTALANVGKMKIHYNTETEKVEIEGVLLSEEDCQDITPDETVVKRLEELEERFQEQLQVRVADTASTLWGGTILNVAEGRVHEINLGNLIADSMLDAGEEIIHKGNVEERYRSLPIVSVENGGGIRATIHKGTITKGDIINVLPFGNVVSFKAITPKLLYEVLEVGVSGNAGLTEDGLMAGTSASGGFAQIGGMKFVYDPNQPAGQKVKRIYLDGETDPLDREDESREIILASNDYLIAGGNGYTMLADLKTVAEGGALDVMLENTILKRTEQGAVDLKVPVTENRIVIESDIYAPADYTAKVKVLDASGEPVADQEISYYVDDGESRTGTTDADGLLTLAVSDGPHTVGVENGKQEAYICNYTGTGIILSFTKTYPAITLLA